MTVKLVLAVVSCALAILFSVQQYRSNEEKKQRAAKGRIPVAIEDAQANNQREVTLPAPIPLYAAVRNLDEALAHYTTVIAQPISKVSKMNASGEIQTWYKARVIDFLSQPVNLDCRTCSHSASVPSELQPIATDQIVFSKNGGALVSDGIQVTSVDRVFPDMQVGRAYLLFISFDAFTRVGSLELGPTGVSAINADGTISPISESHVKLHKELKSRYGKIDQIKQQLQFRRFLMAMRT